MNAMFILPSVVLIAAAGAQGTFHQTTVTDTPEVIEISGQNDAAPASVATYAVSPVRAD